MSFTASSPRVHNVPKAAVISFNHAPDSSASRFANASQLPLLFPGDDAALQSYDVIAVEQDGKWGLAFPDDVSHPIFPPFFSSALRMRALRASPKSELILKAVGAVQAGQWVLDATGGWGRDAFLLASFGHHVVMCERSPILSFLLQRAIERLRDEMHPVAERLECYGCDALQYIQAILFAAHSSAQEPCDGTLWGKLFSCSPSAPREKAIFPKIHHTVLEQRDEPLPPTSARPSVIYLDPMFPVRTKSALVKKDMQLLHRLLGADCDHDASAVLAKARLYAVKRVVVKRPSVAPPLEGEAPSFCYEGKQMRFDVYLPIQPKGGEDCA